MMLFIKIWKYLQQCSPSDILGLPLLTPGLDLRTLNLSDEERLFLGMHAGVASISPRNKVSPFSSQQNGRKNKFRRIAEDLYKIKHWNIIHGDYRDIENKKATWFIDPPYQFGGQHYIENEIDYSELSIWCQNREGQVIVCENMKADWLPFLPMSKMRGANLAYTTEAIWCNSATNFDHIQTDLFSHVT